MADKNYVVSSIKKVTTQYGDLFNASFKMEELQKMAKRGWVNITIAERRERSVVKEISLSETGIVSSQS